MPVVIISKKLSETNNKIYGILPINSQEDGIKVID